MSGDYLSLLLLFGVSIVNAIGMVVASHILNPRRDTPQKLMPYESGMIPLGTTRARFSVKFYMVAISFIVFDLETIFLIPGMGRILIEAVFQFDFPMIQAVIVIIGVGILTINLLLGILVIFSVLVIFSGLH